MPLATLDIASADVATQVEVWTGTRLGTDGVLRVLPPAKWSAARAALAAPAPRQVWPLAALRDPLYDEKGPFGRSHLSGR
jgi:hypothetical protein